MSPRAIPTGRSSPPKPDSEADGGTLSRCARRDSFFAGVCRLRRPPVAPSVAASNFPIRSMSRSSGPPSTAGRADDHATAFATFLDSCRALKRRPTNREPDGDHRRAQGRLRARRCGGPARRGWRAQVFRGQFPAAAHQQARRHRWLSHRILRADHRRLTRTDRRVHRAALSPAAKFGRVRPAQARRFVPEQRRQSRPPRRPPQDRALLRSRRDRRWRARRLASGDLLGAQPGRCAVRANPGFGTDQTGRPHHFAPQLQFA